MTLRKREDGFRTIIYKSPLDGLENENARQLAELVEQFMVESLDMQALFIACRVRQIYDYADKQLKEKKNAKDK